jgi:hypothetical protein
MQETPMLFPMADIEAMIRQEITAANQKNRI